jgi:hypothetical protein
MSDRRLAIAASLTGAAALAMLAYGTWHTWKYPDRVPEARPAPVRPEQPRKPPPFPLADEEVHVVSIYQAPGGTAEVVVGATERPVLLFLSAHQQTHWRVRLDGGSLRRIIAVDEFAPRVTLDGAQADVLAQKSADFYGRAAVTEGTEFPRDGRGNRGLDADSIITALFGAPPASFQGLSRPQAPFRVDAASPKIMPPQPRSVDSLGPAPVKLEGPKGIDGLSVLHQASDAYTLGWASRAYTHGKVYFEAQAAVEGGPAASHANVGVGEVDPEGRLFDMAATVTSAVPYGRLHTYARGDVVGIAADYDAGLLYARINGRWITGEPGSRTGLPFRTGRERAAYALATDGKAEGERAASVSWQVNFGASSFRDPVPAGYTSYDGNQRR